MSRPPSTEAAPPAIELSGITRRFGPVVANDDVHLTVRPRSIHALVGENGAGKSTLMKILSGVLAADAGTIAIDGQRVARHDVATAQRLGLGMVHQHFMLVEPLTVAENVVLGREPTRRGLLDLRAAAAAVRDLGRRHDLPIDPEAVVADLSVGERQRVEILKVLFRGARLLVLDEPTAVLTPREVDGLFAMLRRFVAGGATVVLITHKLDEVMAVSDHVTVMRRGRTVARLRTAETSPRQLAHLMVGREVSGAAAAPRAAPLDRRAAPALTVERLTVAGRGARPAVAGVSLAIRPGEVLGVAGVQGNGQTELLECLAGLREAASGSVRLGERDITSLSPRRRAEAGLAHLPEDRHQRGLVLDFTVGENAILGRQREFAGLLGLARERVAAHAAAIVRDYDVRPPDIGAPARGLSGGNQQKVVVGRELTRRPRVLLAGQPTRGVDIGAVEVLHDHIRRARDAGTAVLLVSADLAELLALSDRVAVMHGGALVARLDAAEATVERLGRLMTGADA